MTATAEAPEPDTDLAKIRCTAIRTALRRALEIAPKHCHPLVAAEIRSSLGTIASGVGGFNNDARAGRLLRAAIDMTTTAERAEIAPLAMARASCNFGIWLLENRPGTAEAVTICAVDALAALAGDDRGAWELAMHRIADLRGPA